mgnify:CR=1 FL=1
MHLRAYGVECIGSVFVTIAPSVSFGDLLVRTIGVAVEFYRHCKFVNS